MTLPLLAVAALWMAWHPLLVALQITYPVSSLLRLLEQGLLLGLELLLTLKYPLALLLFGYFITSYIYLGGNPLWDFVATTGRNLVRPLGWLPLRFSRVDLRPLVGVILVLVVLHWVPVRLIEELSRRQVVIWPT